MANINFEPNTIFCSDNLPVLRNMNSECADLIYLDPPFNKQKKFTAPIGSSAVGAEFRDYFSMSDVEEQWVLEVFETNKRLYHFLQGVQNSNRNEYNYAYLVYMAMRLMECHRILKPTGSIYYHCDHTMAHYIKLAMDLVFGEKNFRNEIVWWYNKWTNAANYFQRNHDTIFFYSKDRKYAFNKQFVMTEHKEKVLERGYDRNVAGGNAQLLVYDRMKAADKIATARPRKMKVVYMDGKPDGVAMPDVWDGINYLASGAKERTGYPTQKPLALLQRIIQASSNKGDLVLDPFCGCATACVAAQALGRKWVGIDVSIKAYQLMEERMGNEIPSALQDEKYHFRTDMPKISERHPNKRKYLYVIRCASFPGQYKVGYATNLKSRLGAYKTSTPGRDYAVEFSVETQHHEACEKYIHKKFNADYEWVTADVKAVIKSIKAYLKRADANENTE